MAHHPGRAGRAALGCMHAITGALVLAALALQPVYAQTAAAQPPGTGTVRGHVRHSATGAPVPNAQVSIANTRLGALTGADGGFVIAAVPAGAQRVRVRLIGYAPVDLPVTVAEGGTATADATLSEAAISLDEVVVTGTAGQARRREVGNSIGSLNAADVPEATTDVSNLLQGRIAGASVQLGGGSAGAGSSIRLRGNTSVALSNQPLIYVDGVRVRGDEYPKNVPPAGSNLRGPNVNASPLNDINPDDIERIEVLKGAAASTLYGTEAAAGVIQIFTKRGQTGAPTWSAQVNAGINRLRPFGVNDGTPCTKTQPCADYIFINPWLRDGARQDYSLSVNGGQQGGLHYFVSGAWGDNQGVLPKDDERKYALRGNFGFQPFQTLTFEWNSAYSRNDITNTPAGNNAAGLTLNAFRRNKNYFGSANIDTISQVLTYDLNTTINHFLVGGTANFTPIPSITNRLTVGLDRSDLENRNLRPFGTPSQPTGALSDQQWNNSTITADYVGTWEHDLRILHSTLGWGAQSTMSDQRDVSAYTEGFPGPGEPTVSSGSQWVGAENRVRINTGGFFFQEMLGWRDRLFVTAGIRFDKYSAFGQNLGLQNYPKVSASYVVSDESFFPRRLGTLKLRAAYGQAGRAPGAFDALQTYNPVGWGGQPAFRTRSIGNKDLGPERSKETEVGFDATTLGQRMTIDFTWYRTRTTDALLPVSLIPSQGFIGSQLFNVGKLDKQGVELAVNTTVLQSKQLGWDVGLNLALSRNKVVSLGGAPPFQIANFGWAIAGQPLAVLRGRYIKNANEMADPIIEENHLFGPSQPTRIIGLSSALRLPHGIELSGRGEYQGGYYMNEDASFQSLSRAVQWPSCFGAYAKETAAGNRSGWTARERATCDPKNVRQDMFIFKADFFKLRDVTLRAPLPTRFLRGAKSASISLSVQNWYTWKNKDFKLFDPEMAGNDGFNAQVRYISEHIPAPATVLASLRLTF